MNVWQTPRLHLRLIALEDIENVHGLIYSDPEVAIPLEGRVSTLEEVRAPNRLLTRIARAGDEPGLVAIERMADRAMLGIGGLVEIRRAEDRARFAPPDAVDVPGAVPGRTEAEFVMALGRSYWHRGYATEAGNAILELGFTSLRLARVVASVASTNERGQSLLRRLGFRLVPNGVVDARSGAGVPGLIGILDAPAKTR